MKQHDDLWVTEYRPAMSAPPRPGDYAIVTFRDPCGRQWQEQILIARWHFGGARPGVDLPIDEHERKSIVQILTPVPPPRPVDIVTVRI